MKSNDGSCMEKGGEREGIIRIMMALDDEGQTIDPDTLFKEMRFYYPGSRFRKPTKTVFMNMIREQSHLLEIDEHTALKALTRLIPTIEGRKRALETVSRILLSKRPLTERQKILLARLRKILGLQYIYLEKFRTPPTYGQRMTMKKKFDKPL